MLNRADYCIRRMLESDLDLVLTWRNSDRIRSCMYTDDRITLAEHHQWYQRTVNNSNSVQMIFEAQNRAVGVINATHIDQDNGRCSWGFYLGDTTAPKGSSYLMGLLFLDWIFDNLSIDKVCSEVLSFNEDSLRFHQNLGFEQEGILERHILKQGVYTDVVIFGLLADRWKHQRIQTESRLFTST